MVWEKSNPKMDLSSTLLAGASMMLAGALMLLAGALMLLADALMLLAGGMHTCNTHHLPHIPQSSPLKILCIIPFVSSIP